MRGAALNAKAETQGGGVLVAPTEEILFSLQH